MTKSFDILGIGVPYLDLVVQVNELPKVNQSLPMQNWALSGGGKVPTALVTAQRLGLYTGLITGIPTGIFGELIQKELLEEGVDFTLLETPTNASLSVVITDGATKGRTIIYSKGGVPASTLFQQEVLFSTKLLLISSIGPTELDAVHWARDQGIPIMVDADYYDPTLLEYVGLIDLWIASEHFFLDYKPSLRLEEKLHALYSEGPSVVIVTLGERGCWVRDDKGLEKLDAFEVDVVDTTGAGDVFHGAYGYAFLQGWSPRACAVFASAVSAMKCRDTGGRKGIPCLAEVKRFLADRGRGIPDFK